MQPHPWGQSTIEYLLLLAVVVILTTAVLRNPRFQGMLGAQGTFFQDQARAIRYTYRHGVPGISPQGSPSPFPGDSSILQHDTYSRKSNNKARFVIPLGLYPR